MGQKKLEQNHLLWNKLLFILTQRQVRQIVSWIPCDEMNSREMIREMVNRKKLQWERTTATTTKFWNNYNCSIFISETISSFFACFIRLFSFPFDSSFSARATQKWLKEFRWYFVCCSLSSMPQVTSHHRADHRLLKLDGIEELYVCAGIKSKVSKGTHKWIERVLISMHATRISWSTSAKIFLLTIFDRFSHGTQCEDKMHDRSPCIRKIGFNISRHRPFLLNRPALTQCSD